MNNTDAPPGSKLAARSVTPTQRLAAFLKTKRGIVVAAVIISLFVGFVITQRIKNARYNAVMAAVEHWKMPDIPHGIQDELRTKVCDRIDGFKGKGERTDINTTALINELNQEDLWSFTTRVVLAGHCDKIVLSHIQRAARRLEIPRIEAEIFEVMGKETPIGTLGTVTPSSASTLAQGWTLSSTTPQTTSAASTAPLPIDESTDPMFDDATPGHDSPPSETGQPTATAVPGQGEAPPEFVGYECENLLSYWGPLIAKDPARSSEVANDIIVATYGGNAMGGVHAILNTFAMHPKRSSDMEVAISESCATDY